MRCEIINLRFLTSEIAVVHIAMKTESDNDTIATAAMQQQEGEWLIISYHNAHASHNPRTMDNPTCLTGGTETGIIKSTANARRRS